MTTQRRRINRQSPAQRAKTAANRAGARSPANQRGEGAYQPRIPRPQSQATKAAALKALGKVGGPTKVTIAQVRNDPSIKANEKATIIKALQRSQARRTEG